MAAGTASSMAQGGKLNARPLTHQDIHDYMLPADTQASGGLHTVGLGQPAYLDALVDIDVTGITGVDWAITVQPIGASDVLEPSPLTPAVPIYEPKDRELFQLAKRNMLRPTVEGRYTVEATVNTDGDPIVLTLDLTAATYLGIDSCSICHNGTPDIPNKLGPWSATAHATFFIEAIDGIKSSHYNSGCVDCHLVGYDTNPLAVNGGFDDVAASLGWTFPTELIPGNWDLLDPSLQNLANIQCENCHGPGKQHVLTAALGDPEGSKDFIHVNYNSGDCAQCHSEEPYHVYPLQWENSSHAVGYQRAGSCSECHQGLGFIQQTKGLEVTGTDDSSPITCSTCHEPHDATNPHQIRSLDDVTLKDTSKPGGPTVITEGGNGKLCMQCHISRRDAVTYVEEYHGHYGPHHGPQTDMLVGANAIDYGNPIPSSAHREVIEDSCVTCHMQGTDRDSDEHLFAGGHTWNMAWDGDGGGRVELLNACNECHGDLEEFDFKRVDFDGNGIVEGVQTEVKGLLHKLAMMLPPLGSSDVSVTSSYTPEQLKGAYNYLFVEEDGSFGIHNLPYAVGLLKASIGDLSGDSNGDNIADWWQAQYFGADWVNNPDAAPNASPAGDDVPNWMKFTLGLDPHVAGVVLPDGVLLVNGTTISGGEAGDTIRIYTAAEVVFDTEVGMEYQIQVSSELSNDWQNVGVRIAGTGVAFSYLTPMQTPMRDDVDVKQFFRVIKTTP